MAERLAYVSTRGRAPERGFTDILLSGLADDGGLYVPAHYPQVSVEQLQSWRGLSYAELATEIIVRYATDVPRARLAELCRTTYSAQVYANARNGSDADDITPLRWLEPGFALLELSNGPTLAFKDIAMQLLGALFEFVLRERGVRLNVLGATSGDTGSAAEYALRGRAGIQVFMLSPQGRMSAFQRAQMYSLQDANIHNLAVAGTFDDCQDLVKAVSSDLEFKARWNVGSVNSINWGRIVAQVVYYFRAYLAATSEAGQRVSFAVPSGNFGNILSGWIARKMGLPIDKLVLATNENDVLDEFFRTGRYRVRGGARLMRRAARRWTSARPPISSAGCSISSAAIRTSCASSGGRSTRVASFTWPARPSTKRCGAATSSLGAARTSTGCGRSGLSSSATAWSSIRTQPTASRSRSNTGIPQYR